jgi:hypothetical protein
LVGTLSVDASIFTLWIVEQILGKCNENNRKNLGKEMGSNGKRRRRQKQRKGKERKRLESKR